MALTDLAIKKAVFKDGPYRLTDSKGLTLLIHPNGSKYWQFRFRFADKGKLLALTTTTSITGEIMAKRDSTQAITPCHTRQIKVTKTYYTSKKAKHGYGADNVPVLWIQIKGFWLQRAGFDINSPITIQVMEGCLVLIAGETTPNIAGAPSISQKQLKLVRKLLVRLAAVEVTEGAGKRSCSLKSRADVEYGVTA